MKIILDTDGTVTDFNAFIEKHAISHFVNKGMPIVNPDQLEIEDIFDMKNYYMKTEQCSEIEAEKLMKKSLDEFWVGINFLKFSLLGRFRDGVQKFVNDQIKAGHEIEVHTSRAKTTEESIIGTVAREFTIAQYIFNGIRLPRKNFKFYSNDQEKIAGIIAAKPDLALEDKPYIVDILSKNNIKTFCISGIHNKEIVADKNIEILDNFIEEEINSKAEKLIGARNLRYYERAASANITFNKIKPIFKVVPKIYKPIIINEDKIMDYSQEAVIYAPNHMSTLDPFIIMASVNEHIQWAALLRFFEGEDSIFNNSKSKFLCKLTADYFKKLEYFPIDRPCDNPEANNLKSTKEMLHFLNINQRIGIFPEGTTRKENNEDFGTFNPLFLKLAQKSDAYVQSITSLWLNDPEIDSKIILNYGEPFKVNDMTIDEALEYYKEMQTNCLKENKLLREELLQSKGKVKKLVRKL